VNKNHFLTTKITGRGQVAISKRIREMFTLDYKAKLRSNRSFKNDKNLNK